MTRRSALGLLLLLAACGARVAPPRAGPRRTDLRIEPLTDVVPAAGLVWLLDLRPQELMTNDASRAAIAEVLPEDRFAAFASRHGGIDPRAAKELVVASYTEAVLTAAEVPFDPGSVEAAFASRALGVDGRAVEGDVIRSWGSFADANGETTREQLALLGRDAAMLERGHLGPLRAAVAFSEGKLHRSLPALRADPLARAAALLGDAPARAFAPGPFEGEWAAGLGGLLRASTAAAVSASPRGSAGAGGTANLFFRIVLLGAWGTDAPAAADRLRAAFDVLSNDPLGKLMGVDHPVEAPRASGGADALVLEVALDSVSLARGLHAATAATVADIMRF